MPKKEAIPDDFPVQPVTQVFRAPTDNDKSFGNWLAKDWKLHGMDHPQINLESFHHEKRADGAAIVRIQTSNLYKEGKVVTTSIRSFQMERLIWKQLSCHKEFFLKFPV